MQLIDYRLNHKFCASGLTFTFLSLMITSPNSSDSDVIIYDLAALPEGSCDESSIQLKVKSRKAALQGHCSTTFKYLSNKYVKVKKSKLKKRLSSTCWRG